MSEKIIIDNQSSRNMEDALFCVMRIVADGMISGHGDKKQYCYLTAFHDVGLKVGVFKNEKSQRFVITDLERPK